MKKLILILLLTIPFVGFSQFEIKGTSIKYTDHVTKDKVKEYWENTKEEIDEIEGIYEPMGSFDISVLDYIIAIIKVDDYYEIIMLGEGYGTRDVNKGGVKATVQKMPPMRVVLAGSRARLRWVVSVKRWRDLAVLSI